MAHSAPEWLTAELLSDVLGEEVVDLKASAAVPAGNNYGSVVTLVSVTVKNRADPLSIIVKSELTEGAVKESFDVPDTIEHDFYHEFLHEAGKITETNFAPKHFPIAIPTKVVLEDLKSGGFEMADRTKQLDFDHCRLYMIAAAKFHAVSLVVHKRKREVVEKIGEEKLFAHHLKGAESIKMMIRGGIHHLLKATREMEQFKRARGIVEAVKDQLFDMVVDAHKRRDCVNTINQGDPWTTNMMFRYDENRIVREIKLIDFQCLRFGSPVNDVVSFIWCSANNDVKTSRLPELYKIYLQNFNENLRAFGSDVNLSEDDFMDSVRKLSPLILHIVATSIPLIVSPEPMDFEKLGEDEIEFFNKSYNEHYCRHHVPKSMEQLEQEGVFDYLEQYLLSSN